MAGKKGLRLSEDDLQRITARPGYGTSIVSRADVKAAQVAINAVMKAGVDPTAENAARAEHALRLARAAAGEIEAMFEVQLLEVKWPALCEPRFQWRPLPKRKIRLDVAFPFVVDTKPIGIEVQGHVHRIKARFLGDMERHNLLTEAGWLMYYVSGDMIRDGRAVALAKRIMRA